MNVEAMTKWIEALEDPAEDRYLAVHTLNDAGWSFWDIAQALRATHLKENT